MLKLKYLDSEEKEISTQIKRILDVSEEGPQSNLIKGISLVSPIGPTGWPFSEYPDFDTVKRYLKAISEMGCNAIRLFIFRDILTLYSADWEARWSVLEDLIHSFGFKAVEYYTFAFGETWPKDFEGIINLIESYKKWTDTLIGWHCKKYGGRLTIWSVNIAEDNWNYYMVAQNVIPHIHDIIISSGSNHYVTCETAPDPHPSGWLEIAGFPSKTNQAVNNRAFVPADLYLSRYAASIGTYYPEDNASRTPAQLWEQVKSQEPRYPLILDEFGFSGLSFLHQSIDAGVMAIFFWQAHIADPRYTIFNSDFTLNDAGNALKRAYSGIKS